MKLSTILSLFVFMFPHSVNAGDSTSSIPSSPNASTTYIFYLHGSNEESEGSTSKYETAVEAIAESSVVVISEVRDDTNPNEYAAQLKSQVEQMIANGATPNKITISGYSKGAVIALSAAGMIANPEINYVLLAGCSDYLNGKYDINTSDISGRILSVYDSGDSKFGSCTGILSTSEKVDFDEIELDSGKGHKLFRIPKEKFIEQWRDPLVDWAGA